MATSAVHHAIMLPAGIMSACFELAASACHSAVRSWQVVRIRRESLFWDQDAVLSAAAADHVEPIAVMTMSATDHHDLDDSNAISTFGLEAQVPEHAPGSQVADASNMSHNMVETSEMSRSSMSQAPVTSSWPQAPRTGEKQFRRHLPWHCCAL